VTIQVRKEAILDTCSILKDFFEGDVREILHPDGRFFYCQYKNYRLKINVPNAFPKELPEFFIEDYQNNNYFFTHIDSMGKICFISEDNLIWNHSNGK
jgi:hypothetical protein